MGMGLDDFMRLTPEEFTAVHSSWIEHQTHRYHTEMEMMRLHACMCIQPHLKKRLSPHQLLPFDWDSKSDAAHKTNAPQLTREQQRERMLRRLRQIEDASKAP